jgi:hypothetical protein
MKCRLLWLAAMVFSSIVLSACFEDETNQSPGFYPGRDVSPTPSPAPSVIPTRLPPLPTPNPPPYSEPVVLLSLFVPENALVNAQYPAFVEAELIGRGVESVAQIAGQNEENGRQRVLSLSSFEPDDVADGRPAVWREGVHELPLVWTAEADVLSDGGSKEYVVFLDEGNNAELPVVAGRYRRAGDGTLLDVRLLVDPSVGAPVLVHDVASGGTFDPRPGDEFQPYVFFLGEGGQIVTEPGQTLVFDAAKQLGYARQLVPAGSYFLGAMATIPGSPALIETVDFIVEDVPLVPGFRAYLDPDDGFQFLYPAGWPVPAGSEDRLTSGNSSGSIVLNITLLRDIGDRAADRLKRETIESFGSIQILFEDLISIGAGGGLWTAYGYDSSDGPHTGVFVILTDNEIGYIIDVDGRQDSEELLLEIVQVLTDSWTFRPAGKSNLLGDWVRYSVSGLNVTVPADHTLSALENGWQRFSAEGDNAFVAVRIEDGRDVELEQRHGHWLDVAGASVDDFAASASYEVERSTQKWIRSDFSYSDLSGNTVLGSVTGKSMDGRLIFVWSEAPAADFLAFDQDVVDVVTADARPIR